MRGIRMRYDTPEDIAIEEGKIDCDGCTHCCKFHGGTVLKSEVPHLARHLRMDEGKFSERYLEPFTQLGTTHFRIRSEKKGSIPYGPCVFLGKKGCRIHEAKPLHCRVGTCKEWGEESQMWFLLNHFLDPADGHSMREYAMHLKTGGKTLPGAYLHELVPDAKRLKEITNYGNK